MPWVGRPACGYSVLNVRSFTSRYATRERQPADSTNDVKRLAAWTAFHEQMDLLPAQEREVFELHWYQGLTHGDAAEVLGVSVDTIKRRWQSARLLLYNALDGELPQT